MSENDLRSSSVDPGDRTGVLVVLAIFALSFLPRLYFMNDGLFSVDEVLIARATESLVKDHALVGGVSGRYGTVILNALLYLPYNMLTGSSAEKIIIFSGVLSGSFVLVAVYLLVFELTENRRVSVLTALFLGSNLLFLVTSTTGKEHIHALSFVLLAFLAIARGAKRRSLRLRIAGSLCFSVSMTLHEAVIPFMPLVLIFLVYSNRYFHSGDLKNILSEAALFLAISALPFMAYLKDVLFVALSNQGADAAYFNGLFSEQLTLMLKKSFYILELPFVILAVPGLYFSFRHKPLFVLTVLWLSFLFYYGNISTGSERYLLFVLPPLVLLPAIATDEIIKKINNRYAASAVLVAVIVAISGYGVYRSFPLLELRSVYCGPKEMALYIKKNTEPDSIVISMDEAPFHEYYGNRRTLSHPVGGLNQNRSFVEQVRTRVRNGEPVYITDSSFSYDPDGSFHSMMGKAFKFYNIGHVIEEGWVRDIIVYAPIKNQVYRLDLADGMI